MSDAFPFFVRKIPEVLQQPNAAEALDRLYRLDCGTEPEKYAFVTALIAELVTRERRYSATRRLLMTGCSLNLGVSVDGKFPLAGVPREVDQVSRELSVSYLCHVFSGLKRLPDDAVNLRAAARDVLLGFKDSPREGVVARIEPSAAAGAGAVRLRFEPSEGISRLAAAIGAGDFESFCAGHELSPEGGVVATHILQESGGGGPDGPSPYPSADGEKGEGKSHG